MHRGFIKLHRKMVEWEWYTDANTLRLFIHLLLKANHKDKKWQGVGVNRGSLITGRKELAQQLCLTEQQIRTSLNKLKSTNEITIKSTSKFSTVTLNNYNQHQDINQQPNQQATNKQPTNNQQTTTTKECKELKEREECKELTPQVGNVECEMYCTNWLSKLQIKNAVKDLKDLTDKQRTEIKRQIGMINKTEIRPEDVLVVKETVQDIINTVRNEKTGAKKTVERMIDKYGIG